MRIKQILSKILSRIQPTFSVLFCLARVPSLLNCGSHQISAAATDIEVNHNRTTTTTQLLQNYYQESKARKVSIGSGGIQKKEKRTATVDSSCLLSEKRKKEKKRKTKFATTLALCSLCSQSKEQELEIEKTAAAATAAKSHKSQVSFVQSKRSFVYLFRSEGRPAAAAAAISLIYKSNLICGAGALCD